MGQQQLIPVTQIALFDTVELDVPVVAAVERSFQEKVALATASIKALVLAGHHLVVAWSAGKDSSVTLALAFAALRELIAAGHNVPTLHIIHSDTLIENPAISSYAKRQIKSIEHYSEFSGIAARVWVASPGLSNDYLVSLLGGRTIASVGANARCQQMMKAAPLTRIKREVRRWVGEATGVPAKKADLVSLIGTRFDESAQRKRMMEERGESATEAVEAMGDGELVMSPIAGWTAMDVFEYIGNVRSGKLECYDRFDDLVEVYRDMNGGDCMVTAYLANKEQEKAPCSARTGCYACGRVSRDASAESMLAHEDGKFAWMKPLNDFRNYLMARHFDPTARCWLGRTVDEETGRIQITPNSYSPAFTLELLGIALTVQVRERIAARKAGVAPRFTMLTLKQVIAIDLLWARYGYQKPWTALRTYLAVYREGKRFRIPDVAALPKFTEKDVAFRAEAPFADDQYDGMFSGLRNIDWAAADCEDLTTTSSGKYVTRVEVGNEFDIDEEGLALFVEFEMEYALSRISLDDSPSAVVHYLLGLGTVQLFKGSHSEWDRMLKMSSQIFRSGLQPYLHDPQVLMTKMGGDARAYSLV
ncbi:phosphoadenosine phosphosulfate reductase family protein [Pseudomonas sp.]|uniref:phosphoadenosine phosphosulfate reductase domain-containing protein n=1 Tax=Pseudomonas sp. TaxID=306 RepID=UPI00290E5B1A|nr:phosphoadenosine phosphosulfate reductase family protein [Pseudomonas sp.]MDU4254495.1 phosphoadenosine phosphosulfate reductase family protein [Pseudomonas sp.]